MSEQMDYVMPNCDGPTATVEVRRLGYRGIIIGLTGQMQQEEVDVFLQSGADEVLGKPLDMARLLELLSTVP
jgi:CheY-like chemotaxis protein